jgi:hypothetical protein
MVSIDTLAEKIDRVESLEQIRLLASRYALAVDSRNLDDLVGLFVDDVRLGRESSGREAMKQWWGNSLNKSKSSIHFVGNHVIDFVDADHATGVVYCRDELERGDEWQVGMIQYWDTYERRDGTWYFVRRKLMRWYEVDALTRPSHGARTESGSTLRVGELPEAWPSWERFWQEWGPEAPRR